MEKQKRQKIYRSQDDKIIGGVCGGIGEYFNIDPIIVRVIFVLSVLFSGSGLILYLILWLVFPNKSNISLRFNKEGVKESVPETEDISYKAEEKFKSDIETDREDKRRSRFFGWFLFFLGIFLLTGTLFPYSLHLIRYWPFLLVLLGLFLLFKKEE